MRFNALNRKCIKILMIRNSLERETNNCLIGVTTHVPRILEKHAQVYVDTHRSSPYLHTVCHLHSNSIAFDRPSNG